MGGRSVLHRTGPGRSAWAVSEDNETVRFWLQDSRQDLKVTRGYMYSSYIMYLLVQDARLTGAA